MDQPIQISSGDYQAAIKSFGAELCSLIHMPSQKEYIWQAEATVWPRHAPVLFPFVGRLKNFEYNYKGKNYSIEQHGFARDLNFEVVQQSENAVVLELKENAHTLQRYPFLFSFKVSYTLNSNKLTMGFEVSNLGNDSMPVSFGGHPAFNASQHSDYIITFENDADPKSYLLDDGYISKKTKTVTDKSGRILVNEHTFDKDALVFKHLQSNWVKMQSEVDGSGVKVSLNNWPYLGIWAKPNSKFICIEPWQGIADASDFEGEVNRKEGIIMLNAHEKLSNSFDIEVF